MIAIIVTARAIVAQNVKRIWQAVIYMVYQWAEQRIDKPEAELTDRAERGLARLERQEPEWRQGHV